MNIHAETSEKALLFYLLVDNSLSIAQLREDFFSSPSRRRIFQKIKELKSSGKTFNDTTLADEMEQKEDRKNILELGDGVAIGKRTEQTEQYYYVAVREVIKAHNVLEFRKEIEKANKERDPFYRIEELVKDYKQEEADPIENHVIANHTDTLRDFVNKRREGKSWGVPLKSCPRLSNALMGIREISVLIAEPKVGKSTFALQVASDIADTGAGVIYYDFENGRLNLMIRQFCRKYDRSYKNIFDSKEEMNLELLAEYKNFAIINDRALSINKIRSHIFNMKRATEQEKVFIVIDSLQKLPMKDLKERRAAIDQWLRDIEGLTTNDPGLSVLMVSEVSRQGLPKESGDIEYTGHFILRLEKVDDMKRSLYIEYARDVESGKTIGYEVDFGRWKFTETEKQGDVIPRA